MLLLRIDKNVVYDQTSFEQKQSAHRVDCKKRLTNSHLAVKKELAEMYHNFKDGSAEVQREWRDLVKEVDREVELALRHTIKRSLQELSRSINGDAKTEPQTLFGVKIVLENGRVDYRPTMINLTHVVNIVAKELISTVAVVPRLRDVLAAQQQQQTQQQPQSHDESPAPSEAAPQKHPSFYSIISNDEDMLKIVVQIMNGMSLTATELQKYLGYWEKYKPIWEMDKEAYVRRYAKANRSLKNYNDDVTKYKDQQAEIQQENMTHMINFVQLDCGVLKARLVAHCQTWQQKLLGLLNHNARQGLQYLHDLFESNTATLTTPPTTLEELSNKLAVLEQLKADSPTLEAKIPPIDDTYATLAKFDVQVAADELAKLHNLRAAWDDFQQMLDDAKRALDKAKVSMRRDLEASLDNYTQQVHQLREHVVVDLPVSQDLTADEAMAVIADYKRRVVAVRERRDGLRSGLDIFAIETPEHKELKDTEHDLEVAEQIWTLATEWAAQFDEWKTGAFAELDIAQMETVAGQYNKRIGKLGREIKRWGIWEKTRAKLQEFLATLPLIQDLSNPALRPRHWEQLKRDLGSDFDEKAADFTLEAVFATGLNTVPDLVSELSSNANKELAIEEALKDVEARWATVELEVASYKTSYFKIKSTDDLFQTLEDDSVQLSTMKASKFYGSFKDRVDKWEHALGLVSEVIDVLLTVQRKWLYLESIFVGSDDICKQLPRESALFTQVNQAFTQIMTDAHRHPNAVDICTEPTALDKATDMDDKLEAIQKSLDTFLESKRMVFPRFYFISDDDLLAIIGQSREPLGVQKHIKKCFRRLQGVRLHRPRQEPQPHLRGDRHEGDRHR